MRRSPFMQNCNAKNLDLEREYALHKKRMKSICTEFRKGKDTEQLPAVDNHKKNLERTRNFEKKYQDAAIEIENFHIMRRMWEIKVG